MTLRKAFVLLIGTAMLAATPVALAAASNATIYPAPSGEPMSSDYTMQVGGQAVPVYIAKVAPGDASRRMDAMDMSQNAIGHISDNAAFAYFDMQGSVQVSVSYTAAITSAKLLPNVPGTKLVTNGKTVSFTISQPANLTLELNNEQVRTLHIFANPVDTGVPSANDPNVVYFGPGVHEVSSLVVGDGKTLYIAGGAIVRVVAGAAEAFQTNSKTGQRIYQPAIKLQGTGIKVRGRGIIDGSAVPQGKILMQTIGQNVSIEGIILRDPSSWTMPIRNSKDVSVTNVKILGYRLNTDGIDIQSSQTVAIHNSFIRTFDDLIVVKSVASGGPSSNIIARGNVLWNEKGHALSIGAEVQADISNVTFVDNDVIADFGHDWTMRVFLSDAGNVSDINFENIRVNQSCIAGMAANQCPALIAVTIIKSGFGGAQLGNVRKVAFRNIQATTSSPRKPKITLLGASSTSDIEGVMFDTVVVNGRPITKADVQQNAFVKDVAFRP